MLKAKVVVSIHRKYIEIERPHRRKFANAKRYTYTLKRVLKLTREVRKFQNAGRCKVLPLWHGWCAYIEED
jgi:hypothetical protein